MGLFDVFGNFYNGNLFGNNGNSSNNSNNNSGMQNFPFINSLIWPTASTPRPASPASSPDVLLLQRQYPRQRLSPPGRRTNQL